MMSERRKKMNLGKKIVKIRKDNKMSQEELAEALNVTRQTISNWENSKNYPDIETLILISDKFNISLDILLKGDKEMIENIDKKIKNNKKLKDIIIALIIIIFLLIISIFIYDKYDYYKTLNTDYGDYTVAKCNFNNEKIKLYVKVPYLEKKWYEDKVYDPEKVKPSDYFIVNTETKEKKLDLMKKMNINIENYNNCIELLEYMKEYITNNGGSCN